MTENTQGTARATGRAALDAEQQGRINRFALCVPLCVSVYSLSALFWFHLRRDSIEVRSSLQTLYASVYGWFGFSACIVFFLLLLVWTSIWFFAGRVDRPIARLFRLVSVAVMLGVFLSLGKTAADGPTQGELGFYLAQRLVAAIGYPVSWLFVFLGTVASLLLATDFFFSESFERAFGRGAMAKEPDPARDRGVEAVVTEHLKGLAQVSPARPPAPSVDAVDLAAALAEAAEADGADDPAVGTPSPPPATAQQGPAPDPETEPRRYGRRRSYFERRYDDAPAEAWVPAAPESQEIDNPESSPDGNHDRGAVAAADAAAVLGSDANDRRERASLDGDAVEDAIDADAVDEEGDAPIALSVPGEDSDEVALAAGDDGDEAELDATAEDVEVDESELEDEAADAEADAEDATLAADDLGDDDEEEDADEDDEDADEDDVEEDGEAEGSTPAAETLFAIPRPEAQPESAPEPAVPSADAPVPTRQRGLFGPAFDEDLLAEARSIVLASNRPTAALLRRRLRIGYEEACEVLAELSARGLVDLTGEP